MIIAWKIFKILWGAFCLLMVITVCRDVYGVYESVDGDIDYRVFLGMCFWFAIGFLFCLLQNKIRNFKWGIIIHLLLTLLFTYLFVRNTF